MSAVLNYYPGKEVQFPGVRPFGLLERIADPRLPKYGEARKPSIRFSGPEGRAPGIRCIVPFTLMSSAPNGFVISGKDGP